MSTKVSEMTDVDLRILIGEIIEEKLLALLGDDDRLELNDEIRNTLLKQSADVKAGYRGESLEDVVSRLGLN